VKRVPRWLWLGLLGASTIAGTGWLAVGCGWDPRQPFMRNAPEVDRALDRMNAHDYESAQKLLGDYLATGACREDGGLTLSDKVRKRADGSFDLGLTLFYLAEKYGGPFGEEEAAGPDGGPADIDPKRSTEIECALIVVLAIASDVDVPTELRARAAYLAGNLELLRRKYPQAVSHYDAALELVPGIGQDAKGDGIGRDAAWTRAIALRRLEDKDGEPPEGEPENKPEGEPENKPEGEPENKPEGEPENKPEGEPDAGNDGGDEPKPDGGGGQDAGGDDKSDRGDDAKDSGDDSGRAADGGGGKADRASADDGSNQSPDALEPPSESRAPPSSRMLGELREAPSYQEENAKREAARIRRGQTMEDK
jgi:hypothetical protein